MRADVGEGMGCLTLRDAKPSLEDGCQPAPGEFWSLSCPGDTTEPVSGKPSTSSSKGKQPAASRANLTPAQPGLMGPGGLSLKDQLHRTLHDKVSPATDPPQVQQAPPAVQQAARRHQIQPSDQNLLNALVNPGPSEGAQRLAQQATSPLQLVHEPPEGSFSRVSDGLSALMSLCEDSHDTPAPSDTGDLPVNAPVKPILRPPACPDPGVLSAAAATKGLLFSEYRHRGGRAAWHPHAEPVAAVAPDAASPEPPRRRQRGPMGAAGSMDWSKLERHQQTSNAMPFATGMGAADEGINPQHSAGKVGGDDMVNMSASQPARVWSPPVSGRGCEQILALGSSAARGQGRPPSMPCPHTQPREVTNGRDQVPAEEHPWGAASSRGRQSGMSSQHEPTHTLSTAANPSPNQLPLKSTPEGSGAHLHGQPGQGRHSSPPPERAAVSQPASRTHHLPRHDDLGLGADWPTGGWEPRACQQDAAGLVGLSPSVLQTPTKRSRSVCQILHTEADLRDQQLQGCPVGTADADTAQNWSCPSSHNEPAAKRRSPGPHDHPQHHHGHEQYHRDIYGYSNVSHALDAYQPAAGGQQLQLEAKRPQAILVNLPQGPLVKLGQCLREAGSIVGNVMKALSPKRSQSNWKEGHAPESAGGISRTQHAPDGQQPAPITGQHGPLLVPVGGPRKAGAYMSGPGSISRGLPSALPSQVLDLPSSQSRPVHGVLGGCPLLGQQRRSPAAHVPTSPFRPDMDRHASAVPYQLGTAKIRGFLKTVTAGGAPSRFHLASEPRMVLP